MKNIVQPSLIKLALSAAVLANLTACSFISGDDGMLRDRSNDYRQAKVEPALTMPAGVSSDAIQDSYMIPAISDRTSLDDTFEVPSPEPLSEDVGRDAVTLSSLSDQQWILVNGTPGQVWPRLRGFLNLNQFSVAHADATKGIIETVWLQPTTEGALRERYQLRIEQGVQRDTSEVYLLQADTSGSQTQWPAESSNNEREKLMTRELAQYLADNTVSASVSMLAEQAMDSSGKITIEETNSGQPFLNLQLPFSRAWASVGNALKKANYAVEDLNRSERQYFIKALEGVDADGEKRGFFSSLFSGKSKEENADAGQVYLLSVEEQSASNVIISIQQPNGEMLAKSDAERLLKLIKRHIS